MCDRRWRMVLALMVPTLGLGLYGCDDALGPSATSLEQLDAHQALWVHKRPDVYVYTLLRSCECPPMGARPVRITVDGPSVVARVYEDSSKPVPEHLEELFPSVEGLFDIARRALADGQDLTVRYDHHSGVPVEVWVEPGVGAGDDGLGYRVTIPPARPSHPH